VRDLLDGGSRYKRSTQAKIPQADYGALWPWLWTLSQGRSPRLRGSDVADQFRRLREFRFGRHECSRNRNPGQLG